MEWDFKDLIPAGGASGKIKYRVSDDSGTVIHPCVSLELAEPPLQQGDKVGAKLINQLAMKDTAGKPVTTLVSQHDFYDMVMEYTHQKVGSVHRLTSKLKAVERTNAQGGSLYLPSGRIRQVQFAAANGYFEGETFEVDGKACAAKQQGGGNDLPDGVFVAGDLVGALLLDASPQAKLVFRSGGKPPVPSIFGNGSDGDLVIAAGQTVVLPVTVPHQSVVEVQYKSVTIQVGGVLRCSAPNAGLVIRCKGSFTCNGTIDQSMMAPKTNPNNNYPYPAELACGNGGNGGRGGDTQGKGGEGGIGMEWRRYGGGISAGGGGGGTFNYDKSGTGGDSNAITVMNDLIFIGGKASGENGQNGGGGSGAGRGGSGAIGTGGNSPGANGTLGNGHGGGGGGAGNYGGGVMMLYVGGPCTLQGSMLCRGGDGGDGGKAYSGYYSAEGGGGGGGGGGGFYLSYRGTLTNLAIIDVNGGAGGAVGIFNSGIANHNNGRPGSAGTIGTVTIKRYVKEMTV